MKSNPEILVVESQEMFDYVQPMLSHAFDEPQLVHCKTHQEAMQYVASDRYADFIFADWDLSGYRFMSDVRRDPENHHTPVVIMSEDTTNKKIVLNSLTSEATFFLAKPFLEKGLLKKLNKALKTIEKRRKNRIHPPISHHLDVAIGENLHLSLPLVDISIDGCLFRVPLETSRQISIYQHASVALNIDEFDILADGEVYRIGYDKPTPQLKSSVLVMIRLSGNEQQERDVHELLDVLGKRW